MASSSDIHAALTRAFGGPFTITERMDLDVPHRYVFLSDQHKGARDGADEFRTCEPAYRAALGHYLTEGYTLVLLGDVEELWEQGFGRVERAYGDTLRLEARFPPGRYFRLWGNHDDDWMNEGDVAKRLRPYMPVGSVYEALRIEVTRRGDRLGVLFLVHGHQGTFGSDKIRPISRLFLRFIYRPLQRLTGIGKQTPAKDACLRGEHDQHMYEWAARQAGLVLIAGHTHRPVWSSRTHLQKLEAELAAAERAADAASPEGRARIAALREEVADRAKRVPPCRDTIKPRPCYFNTGCCKFADGDITGMELADGRLRLVKWTSDRATPGLSRIVLEDADLAMLLRSLD